MNESAAQKCEAYARWNFPNLFDGQVRFQHWSEERQAWETWNPLSLENT